MLKIRSLITKILLLLVVIAMVSTGINQVFTNNNSNNIATVGSEKISFDEYKKLYDQEKVNIQNLLRTALSEEQLAAFGIKRMVLERLVQDKLLDNLIDDMNLKIGDKSVLSAIKMVPSFQNQEGKFDKEKFLQILRNNNVDENQYLANFKLALIKEIVLNALKYLPNSYQEIAKIIYNYRFEQRLVSIKTLLPSMVNNIPTATKKELQNFYKGHQQQFWSPEYRKAQYVIITKDNVDTNVSVTEKEIADQFKDLEERRDIGYIFTQDAESADNIYSDIQQSNKKISDIPDYKKMDNISVNMLPEELQEVFLLDEGQISKPQKVNSGYFIFYIDKKYKISAQEKEKVMQSIRLDIANNKINNRLEELINTIEEKLSSGIKIEALAPIYNFKIEEIGPIDANSLSIDKLTLAELIFGEENNNSFIEVGAKEKTSKYYYTHVLEVLPSKLQEFDECKKKVQELWKADFINKKMYEMAIDDSINLAGIDKTIFRTSTAITESPKQDYPASFASEIFNLKVGESTKPIDYKDNKVIIARLKEIKPAARNKLKVSEIEDEIKKKIIESMYIEFKDYLHNKFTVKVNEKFM